MVLGGCFFDSLSINCLVYAFQSSSSGFVSLFTYLTIVYSLLSDKFIFEQTVTQSQFIAALVIIVSAFVVSVHKAMYKVKT